MNRIRKLRKEKKITMKQLGGEMGVTETAISYYETEQRQPPQETLKKLADYFEVSIDYLLGRDEIKKEPPASGSSFEQIFIDGGITPERLNSLPESKKKILLNIVQEFVDDCKKNK